MQRLKKLAFKAIRKYRQTVLYRKQLASTHEEGLEEHLRFKPKFSMLVPVYCTPEQYLREMIDSVCHQTYPHFELCLVDASPDAHPTQKIIESYSDSRIRYTSIENKGISENTNVALYMATGEYIVLLDHDDVLTPNALMELAKAVQEKQHTVLYSDEDKLDHQNRRCEPHIKPDFSWDLLRSVNYITHLTAVKRSVALEVGGFHQEFDGAQDYDFILRCCERAQSVHHIPKVLYTWRKHAQSTASVPESKLYAYQAGERALNAHFQRLDIPARAQQFGFTSYHTTYSLTEVHATVVMDVTDPLKAQQTIRSLERSATLCLEYICVVSQTDCIKEWGESYSVRWIVCEKENSAQRIEQALLQSRYDTVLLVSEGIEVENGEMVEELIATKRSDVAMVSGKVMNSKQTILHTGVAFREGYPFLVLNGAPNIPEYYRYSAHVNYLAVGQYCTVFSKKEMLDMWKDHSYDSIEDALITSGLYFWKQHKRVIVNNFSVWVYNEKRPSNLSVFSKRYDVEKDCFYTDDM